MKFISNLSIVVKITIVSASLAAIFLGSSFGYSITKTRESLTQSAVNLLRHEVDSEVSKLETVSNEIGATVVALSGTPPIQGIIRARNNNGFDELGNSTIDQWRTRLAAIFTAETNSTGHYYQLRYIDENGNEMVRVDNTNSGAKVVSKDDLQNKRDRPYFVDAMKESAGELYISKAELNKEGSPPVISKPLKPVVRVAIPIFSDVDNTRKGILIANVDVNYELTVIEEESSKEFESYIINPNGYYIENSDESKEWGGPNDLGTGNNFYKDFPDIEKSNFDSNSGSFINNDNLFVYSKARINPNEEWIIIRHSPTNILFKDVNTIAVNSILIGLSTFGVLFFVFLFAIKKLLSSLEDLTDATSKIAKGDFNQKVEVSSNDEIGKLSVAFNAMTQTLKELYEDLDKKVEERTKELERTNRLMIGREVKMSELKKQLKKMEGDNNA